MPRRALGQLHPSTRRLLRAIDASRPLLCLLAVLLSAAFTVLLYVHIPKFTKKGNVFPEDQPMYVLPSAIILVHICAATIGIEAYNRIVVPQTPDWLCSGAFSIVAFASAVFAPVVGWVAFKAFPGPSIDGPIHDPAHTADSGDTIPSLARLEPDMFDEHPEDCPLAARAESRSAAHAVFSSVWARLAIAAAAMESTSHETLHLFTHHASTLGNGLIVLCTIALAAPDGSTMMPEHTRALGVVTIVVAVLYQVAVFVPETFARPPAMMLLFLLCFTHDVANIIGALSSIGTCEGSSCVSMAGYGFIYDVSTTGLAVLGSMTLIIPFFTIVSSVGIIVDFSDGVFLAVMAVFTMVAGGGLAFPVLLALFPAIALCVPCLSLVAAVVIGLGPRDPAAAAEHTLLHVFCDEVAAAFMRAAAMVGPDLTAESVPLPPLCDSSVLCHGPRAAEIHILRHRAAQHVDKLTFRPVETLNAAALDNFDVATSTTARSHSSSSVSLVDVFTGAHAPNAAANVAAGEGPDAEPLREIVADDLAQQFAVSMAEAAAVLTPHPTPGALPANVQDSPLAYLAEHLAEAEMATSAERRAPLVVFMDEAGMAPSSSDEAAPSVITALPRPTAAPKDNDYCHIDLATETFDDALRGGWRWLLRFAWRRRSFAPLPGHATPGVFVDMWRVSGDFGYTKAFGAWGTLAALLLSRPVLFLAPLLEPAFNANVPTAAYVCIAVRVVCWVGIALLAPAVYRTVCRTAAFSVVNGPEADCTVSEALSGAARHIAAAYDPHLPTVLRGSVPHYVVSHVVIGDAVAPFLPASELGNVPYG